MQTLKTSLLMTNRNYTAAMALYRRVARRHLRGEGDTLQQEADTLRLLRRAATEGCTAARVADAVLSAANDWATLRLTRHGLFVQMLGEAIAAGALSPADDEAWQWLAAAHEANPEADLTDDYERLYDFLMTAAEEGCTAALDLALDIWPPEEEQEED